MNILKTSRELNDEEVYLLCMQANVNKMSDAEGQVLELEAWALYEDENARGETNEVLAILTKDGDVFGTISATFIKEFNKMADHFKDRLLKIKVVSGTTKNGRQYISCAYAK